MNLTMYQIDAFAERVFEGNPAAICPLQEWLDDSLLQAIAEENNLSETAYFVKRGDAFELRWFTPVAEVDLCGHATLASAHTLYKHLGYDKNEIRFLTKSGELTVTRGSNGLTMDFPASPPDAAEPPAALLSGLGREPEQVLAAFDYVAVYKSEEEVRALEPDFLQLQNLDLRGVIATAPGTHANFVARCFYPKLRINEDPVTGSAYCILTPYWSARTGRRKLSARQLSKRGGSVGCVLDGDRVQLTGNAVDYMTATLYIDT